MIRVTVEIVPFGDESSTRQIGKMEIWNLGTTNTKSLLETGDICDYGARYVDIEQQSTTNLPNIVHDRDDGIESLIAWAFYFLESNRKEGKQ